MFEIWFCGSDGQSAQPPNQSIHPLSIRSQCRALCSKRPAALFLSKHSTIGFRGPSVTDALHPTRSRTALCWSRTYITQACVHHLCSEVTHSLGRFVSKNCGNGVIIFGLGFKHSFDCRLANRTGFLQQLWSPRCRRYFRL